jgi:hypothetical protein
MPAHRHFQQACDRRRKFALIISSTAQQAINFRSVRLKVGDVVGGQSADQQQQDRRDQAECDLQQQSGHARYQRHQDLPIHRSRR